MIIIPKYFFKNLLDDKAINAALFYLFSTMMLARLIKANDKVQYFAMITLLQKELSNTDIHLTRLFILVCISANVQYQSVLH